MVRRRRNRIEEEEARISKGRRERRQRANIRVRGLARPFLGAEGQGTAGKAKVRESEV
jgi:hypothetical protein